MAPGQYHKQLLRPKHHAGQKRKSLEWLCEPSRLNQSRPLQKKNTAQMVRLRTVTWQALVSSAMKHAPHVSTTEKSVTEASASFAVTLTHSSLRIRTSAWLPARSTDTTTLRKVKRKHAVNAIPAALHAQVKRRSAPHVTPAKGSYPSS